MPSNVKDSRAARAGVGLAVAAAIVAGTLVARDQLTSNSAVRATTASEQNGTLQGLVHSGPPNGHPFVPFLGPFALHAAKGQHQCGPAVRLMEGALRRKKFRSSPPRNCIGPATKRQIQAFQRSLHYKPSGVYNEVTHQQMVRHGGYTNQARRDLVYLAHQVLVKRERHNVLVITAHAYLVNRNMPYTQGGSRGYFPPWPRTPPATDCSGFVIWVLYQAGVGPAVGYLGLGSSVGWTGTLGLQGQVLKRSATLQPGDLAMYPSSSAGGFPWGHTAIYIGHGLVMSHGGPGINILPLNYRYVGQMRRYIL